MTGLHARLEVTIFIVTNFSIRANLPLLESKNRRQQTNSISRKRNTNPLLSRTPHRGPNATHNPTNRAASALAGGQPGRSASSVARQASWPLGGNSDSDFASVASDRTGSGNDLMQRRGLRRAASMEGDAPRCRCARRHRHPRLRRSVVTGDSPKRARERAAKRTRCVIPQSSAIWVTLSPGAAVRSLAWTASRR